MKNSQKTISLFLCYITISAYIILGNCATFNIGDRMPIKVAEIISIFTILILLFFKVKPQFTRLNKNLLVWIFWGVFSIFINALIYNYDISEVVYGILYPVRLIHLIILTSLINGCFIKYDIETKKIIDYIIFNYIIVCIIGFFQLVFFPNAYNFYEIFYNIGVYFPNADPHIGRLLSTYFDPNYLAQILSIPLAFSIMYWIKYNKNKYFCYIIIISVTIGLTVSRSGFLLLATTFAVLFILNINKWKIPKKLFWIFIIAIIIVTILLSLGNIRVFERILNSSQDQSTIARFESWQKSIDIIKQNPLIGIGYNMLGFYTNDILSETTGDSTLFGSDSSLLLVLITTGLIGIVIFIKIIVQYIKGLPKKNLESYVIITIILSALIGCNFVNLLFYVLWLFPFLIISNILLKDINKNSK